MNFGLVRQGALSARRDNVLAGRASNALGEHISDLSSSRYTWTLFLTHKNDAFHAFRRLAKIIQNKKSLKIISIRSDHGGEFENKDFEMFCDEYGIEHNFSAPRTPQQNGVVERKIDL